MAPRKPANAEPVDGEVVDEAQAQPAAEKVPSESTLALFQRLTADMRKQLKAELGSDVGSLKTQVANLEALITAAEPSGAALTLEEDALSDKIDSMVEDRVKPLREAVAALDEHVKNDLDPAPSVEAWRELEREQEALALNLASLTGVLKDVAPQANRATTGTPAILQALWKVMQDVTYVPKTGQYKGGESGEYSFRKFDDVAKELGEAFRRHGVFLKPQVTDLRTDRFQVVKKYRSGGESTQTWTDTRATVAFTFLSLEDGSEQTISVVGEGRDLSDKSTAKAFTMALKTALTQAFMLPSDAPDPDSERPGQEPDAQPEQHETAHVEHPDPPEVRAANAMKYARQARNLAELTQVMRQARDAGIAHVKFDDGETLQQKLVALRHTLPPEHAEEPPEQE